jgi:hypothetical protein
MGRRQRAFAGRGRPDHRRIGAVVRQGEERHDQSGRPRMPEELQTLIRRDGRREGGPRDALTSSHSPAPTTSSICHTASYDRAVEVDPNEGGDRGSEQGHPTAALGAEELTWRRPDTARSSCSLRESTLRTHRGLLRPPDRPCPESARQCGKQTQLSRGPVCAPTPLAILGRRTACASPLGPAQPLDTSAARDANSSMCASVVANEQTRRTKTSCGSRTTPFGSPSTYHS